VPAFFFDRVFSGGGFRAAFDAKVSHQPTPLDKPLPFNRLIPLCGEADPFPLLYLKLEGKARATSPANRLPEAARRQSHQGPLPEFPKLPTEAIFDSQLEPNATTCTL
jgi:hypothetical protein